MKESFKKVPLLVTIIFTVILPITGIFGHIMILINNEPNIEQLYLALVMFVPFIILFLFRKKIFTSFVIDDAGCSIYYRAQILRQVKWSDIDKINILLNDITINGYKDSVNKPIKIKSKIYHTEVDRFIKALVFSIPNMNSVRVNLEYIKDDRFQKLKEEIEK